MKRLISISVLMSFLFSFSAAAQNTAQVSGTVKDSTGAVLPGVEMTMTQTATGFVRITVTNETGAYVMPNLPIGPYKLEAALGGFSTFVQNGIVLQVDANPVINITMMVGQVSQTLEVQADAGLVETRSTGVGQVIDNLRVVELPLNGRQTSDLIILSGAAMDGGAQASNRNYPTQAISIAGGMNSGVTYLLDGGTHNDPFNNLSMPMPFPDALQEFKVETSALTAQYGQHAAGAVNAVTKSGTNDFHGDLFEFVRNGALNARNPFALTRDALKRNQFGGTVGGPVVRNRLFFFSGEQSTLLRTAPDDNIAFVPTAAMLAGDWTAAASPACNGGRQITLKAPFGNNRIDPGLYSSPALNLVKLKIFPTTSDPCGLIHYGRRSDLDEHIVVSKVDFTANAKHSLFTRYEFARLDNPPEYDGVNILTARKALNKNRAQSIVMGDTYLIGAGTVSSFHATVIRTLAEKGNQSYNVTLSDLGVKGIYLPPGFSRMMQINVSGGFNVTNSMGTPGYTNSTGFQFAEDLSVIRGAHQLGFGANFLDAGMNLLPSTTTPGQFTFGAQYTGLGLGDFMLGKPNNFQQQNSAPYYFRQKYIGLYMQDTWKANSRLTLNLGVRYEPFWAPFEKYGHVLRYDKSWFDQGIRSTVFHNAPPGLLFSGDPGVPNSKSFTLSTWKDFSPRVGFAWDPKGDGNMTVRAAYGLFLDYPNLFMYDQIKISPPWASVVNVSNPNGGFVDPWKDLGGSPYPYDVNANAPFADASLVEQIPLHLKPPYIHQWNLSIQRQVGTDWLVAANYLGNSIIHMMSSAEGNPALYLPGDSCVINGVSYRPCSSPSNTAQRRLLSLQNPSAGVKYGNIIQVDDGGTRHYQALMFVVQKRRAKGVTVQGNYTWSHCIDTGVPASFSGPGQDTLDRRGLDAGNCYQDRRHIFNMSTVYETPQLSGRTLHALGTGWQVSGIVRLLSGPYLTLLSGLDQALTNVAAQRPNQILPSPYALHKNNDTRLNPAAFAQPAIGTYGTMGAQNILGPGSIRIDMGLTRKFQILEKQSVEFRAEAFNVINHSNPCGQVAGNVGAVVCPNLTLTQSTFGRIQSFGDPRIMQFALKYVF